MPARPIHPNAFIGPELSDTDLRLIAETVGYCDAAGSFDGMTIPFAKRAVSDVRHLGAQVRRLQRDNERLIEETRRWSAAVKQLESDRVAKRAENSSYDTDGYCRTCGEFFTDCNPEHPAFGPFPPACPVCGQRRDQCLCPPAPCLECQRHPFACFCDLVPAGTPVLHTPPNTSEF